jgi:hypothetical protein
MYVRNFMELNPDKNKKTLLAEAAANWKGMSINDKNVWNDKAKAMNEK